MNQSVPNFRQYFILIFHFAIYYNLLLLCLICTIFSYSEFLFVSHALVSKSATSKPESAEFQNISNSSDCMNCY